MHGLLPSAGIGQLHSVPLLPQQPTAAQISPTAAAAAAQYSLADYGYTYPTAAGKFLCV